MRFTDAETFRVFVQATLDASTDPDPGVVAEKLIADLTDEESVLALRFTLRPYVSNYARNHDRDVRRGKGVVGTAQDTVRGQVTRSRLRKAGVEWREKVLATRLVVADGVHKFLRDCTPEDLFAAAGIRYEHADRTRAQGDRLRALAEEMQRRRYKTAGQAPERVLRATLTDEGVTE